MKIFELVVQHRVVAELTRRAQLMLHPQIQVSVCLVFFIMLCLVLIIPVSVDRSLQGAHIHSTRYLLLS